MASVRRLILVWAVVVLLGSGMGALAETALADSPWRGPPDAPAVDLLELVREFGAVLEWHPLRQVGVLRHADYEVALRVGTPWVLIDGASPLFVGDIVRESGAVLVSAGGAAALRDRLGIEPPGAGSRRRIVAILIDPGHGGKDPGAIGRHQLGSHTVQEKDVVLRAGKILHQLLQARYPDKQVVLTRDDDRYLSLEQRTGIANSLTTETEDAVIFISVHANASLNKNARGYEVWYLPPEIRRELISPDSLEHDSRELAPILNTMREEEYTRESVFLAQSIVDHFEQRVGDRSVNRGIREESWFVVRNAKMPAVLVELGFLTNEEEARLLGETGYLRTLAEAIYSAVASFVTRFEGDDGLAPEEALPAQLEAIGVAAVAGN